MFINTIQDKNTEPYDTLLEYLELKTGNHELTIKVFLET